MKFVRPVVRMRRVEYNERNNINNNRMALVYRLLNNGAYYILHPAQTEFLIFNHILYLLIPTRSLNNVVIDKFVILGILCHDTYTEVFNARGSF